MKEIKRKCCGCGKIKPRSNMVKVTYNRLLNEIRIDPDSFFVGRSAYICRDEECFLDAFKKGKFYKILRCKADDNLKEKIRAVLGK